MVEAALHDLLQFNLDRLDGTDVGSAVGLRDTVDVQLAFVDVCNVVILEVEDLLSVLNDGRRVGGEEEFGGLGHAVVRKEGAGLGAVEEGLVWWSKETSTKGSAVAALVLLESNVLRGTLRRERIALLVLDIHKVDLHLLLRPHTDHQR